MEKSNQKKGSKKPNEENMLIDNLEIDEQPKTPPTPIEENNQVIFINIHKYQVKMNICLKYKTRRRQRNERCWIIAF